MDLPDPSPENWEIVVCGTDKIRRRVVQHGGVEAGGGEDVVGRSL